MAGDQLDDDDTIDDPEELLERVRQRAGDDVRLRDLDPTTAPPSPQDIAGALKQTSTPKRRGRWVVVAALVSIGLIAAFVAGGLLDSGGEPQDEAVTAVTSATPAGTSAPPNTAADEGDAPTPPTALPTATPTTQSAGNELRESSADDEDEALDDSDASTPASTAVPVPTSDPTDSTVDGGASENGQEPTASDERASVVPSQPILTVEGGRRTVTASWSADDNGSRIVEWQVNDGRLADEPTSSATQFVWRNAQVGSHTIRVRARNAAGWSEWSAESTVSVYDVPNRPSLTAEGGRRTVTASWSAEVNGSRIVEWQVNDGRLSGGPDSNDTNFTWSNAQVGSHTIRVRARNAAGWSEWSPEKQVEVFDTVPSIRSVSATGGINRIRASWSASGTVTYWEVLLENLSEGLSTSASEHTWTDVPAGSHTVRFRACNNTGCSNWTSRQVEVTDPPRSVTVTQGDEKKIPQQCEGKHCAFIQVTVKGFPPGTYTIVCWHRGWPSLGWTHGPYERYATMNSVSQYCVMGVPGIKVYVRVTDSNGIETKSNEYTWPSIP